MRLCSFLVRLWGGYLTWGIWNSHFWLELSYLSWRLSLLPSVILIGSSYYAKDSLLEYVLFMWLLSAFRISQCIQQVACGMCFGPTMSIIGHWFKRRRGIALGFSATGSSLGGTIFPIAARNLIRLVGFVNFLTVPFFSGAHSLQVSMDDAHYCFHFTVHARYL